MKSTFNIPKDQGCTNSSNNSVNNDIQQPIVNRKNSGCNETKQYQQ